MELAPNARRFDQSPARLCFVPAAPALELVERIGVAAIHRHDVGLAHEFRAGLGMPSGDSAIVSADIPGAEQAFTTAGIRAAVRGGKLRASLHAYSTSAGVNLAHNAMDGLRTTQKPGLGRE